METDLNNVLINDYIFLNGKRVALRTVGGYRRYYVGDHLGSTRVLVNQTGGVPEDSDYYPFGGERVVVNNWQQGYKFTGKERDSESGLDNFRFRSYSSALGRFLSADRINLTSKRLVNPSSTLNKYVYGGNNPLLYVDPTGQDITIFYRAPSGAPNDAGHVLLAVTNQATGAVRFADYYAGGASSSGGSSGPGTINQNMTTDRLKKHAALTIRTTPEVAQQLIDAIDALSAQTPDYNLFTSNCVMVCADLLDLAGIDVPKVLATPTDFWAWLYGTYSAEALSEGQLHMGFYRYQPGRDFGESMSVFSSGTNPSYNLELLSRLVEQQRKVQPKMPRGCVTTYGRNGPDTTCD